LSKPGAHIKKPRGTTDMGTNQKTLASGAALAVGPKTHHSSFDDDQLM